MLEGHLEGPVPHLPTSQLQHDSVGCRPLQVVPRQSVVPITVLAVKGVESRQPEM